MEKGGVDVDAVDANSVMAGWEKERNVKLGPSYRNHLMAGQVFLAIWDCGKNGKTQLSGKDGERRLLPIFTLINPDVVKGLANLLR